MSMSTSSIESSTTRPVSCRPMKVFKGERTAFINSCAYFPDGRHIATGGYDKTVIIWDIESGMQDGMPLYHSASVEWIAISPNGRRIASGLGESGMVIWDALTREVVHKIEEANVELLAYSPDGRWIATVTMDESVIRLWDADTGRPGSEPLDCSDMMSVTCVAISPDGSRVAVGSPGSSFKVIDISTGESVLGPIFGHPYWVTSISYSPDGRLLVTASAYDSMRVWDSKTGVEVGNPMGHEGKVRYMSIAPDGRRIASTGDDITLRVWDLETRLQVGDSRRGYGPVAFSPDSRYLINGGDQINLFDTESFAIQGSSSPPTASNPPRQARAKSSSINSSLLDRRRAARNAIPDSESEDDDAESYYEDTGCLDAVCFGEYFRRRRHLQRR
ncbi:WD40 repeat-like protein [Leucogyrophana mollusca]|uniref:WD40 repeat-like protein n=1 Tax=Leucogyrophana mollusca TaxID=85980 RepID=A0ACB8BMB1_9AGAM|nr:WD40 repeat-like protein [Leucogyrophana mollusca]